MKKPIGAYVDNRLVKCITYPYRIFFRQVVIVRDNYHYETTTVTIDDFYYYLL